LMRVRAIEKDSDDRPVAGSRALRFQDESAGSGISNVEVGGATG
jgi:hypothetical protein